MKVKMLRRPTGCVNGQTWPKVGETMDLPTTVAEGMAATGWVELVKSAPKVEKRPAATKKVETRGAKKAD